MSPRILSAPTPRHQAVPGADPESPRVWSMTVKPEIDFPYGPPPADLEIVDIRGGDGAEARVGSQVSVHYVGVAYSTGEEFDASYNRGDPLSFRLGAGRVIAGWENGVAGMKVGGRRQLN